MLPKVLIAGDSICLRGETPRKRLDFTLLGAPGYYPFVEKLLAGKFRSYCLPENGMHSSNLLIHIDEWMIKPSYDIIHFNCGLHDLKRWTRTIKEDYTSTKNDIPVVQYAANLEEIVRRLKSETTSKIIWATTTPVFEEKHNSMYVIKRRLKSSGRGYLRYEKDVVLYNKVAREVMTGNEIPIDDLHKVVEENEVSRCIGLGGVHLTVFGCNIVAKAVAESIMKISKMG